MAHPAPKSDTETATVFNLGFKTKIENPTIAQRIYFAKACGVARFAYNWALEQWQKQYELHKADPEKNPAPSEAALRRQLNAIKPVEFPWMLEVTKCAPQHAIMNLGNAFRNFFRDPEKFRYPQFKKKFRHDSFTISNDQIKIEGSRIRIPNLGWVRMCEPLRFKDAKVLSVTISRGADDWYVSISCELTSLTHLKPAKNQGRVGVDLGILKMAVLSDGHVFEAPMPLKHALARLKILQEIMSRAKRGSRNRQKLRVRIARLHRRIANIRSHAIHKLTAFLASNYSEVVIEDLNVKGMMANHHLARAIGDVGFYEFRRQLEYKMALRGGLLVVAPRFYPSSKRCRFCGGKNEDLTLSDRSWVCPHCGETIEDRDLNAALNLFHYSKDWDSEASASADAEGSSGSTSDKALPDTAPHDGVPASVADQALRGGDEEGALASPPAMPEEALTPSPD